MQQILKTVMAGWQDMTVSLSSLSLLYNCLIESFYDFFFKVTNLVKAPTLCFKDKNEKSIW